PPPASAPGHPVGGGTGGSRRPACWPGSCAAKPPARPGFARGTAPASRAPSGASPGPRPRRPASPGGAGRSGAGLAGAGSPGTAPGGGGGPGPREPSQPPAVKDARDGRPDRAAEPFFRFEPRSSLVPKLEFGNEVPEVLHYRRFGGQGKDLPQSQPCSLHGGRSLEEVVAARGPSAAAECWASSWAGLQWKEKPHSRGG